MARDTARMRWLSRALLIASGTMVAIVLAEIALAPWPATLTTGWVFQVPGQRALDEQLILVPPRLRDPSAYSVVAGRPTLLAMGDSYTEGYPVGGSLSYPAEIARILERSGVAANVINAGWGDSGPDQQLRLFVTHILPNVRPDVVVWQLYANDVNDNTVKAVYTVRDGQLEPISAKDNWLYRRQQIFDRTPLPRGVKMHSQLFQHVLKMTERWQTAQVPRAYTSHPDDWALAKIRLEIGEMERLAQQHHFIPYYVLIVPQLIYLDEAGEKGVEPRPERDYHHKLWELLEPRPRFILIHLASRESEPAWRAFFVSADRDANPLGSRHMNEAGQASTARVIADRLLADGVVSVAK